MQGLQLCADLRDCAAGRPVLTDLDALRTACLAAVEAAGLTPVGELFHGYEARAGGEAGVAACDAAPRPTAEAPAGITGVVLLAESHLAVHTWPELGAATLDVYVCNLGRDNSARAHALLAGLIAAFEPGRIERHTLGRGSAGVAQDARR
ncbi:MAG: S-adenosylmethionine decarboxylase [Caldimonas sp.]